MHTAIVACGSEIVHDALLTIKSMVMLTNHRTVIHIFTDLEQDAFDIQVLQVPKHNYCNKIIA